MKNSDFEINVKNVSKNVMNKYDIDFKRSQ